MKPTPRSSRRSVLKGTVAGVTGLAAVAGVVGAGTFLAQKDQNVAAHAQNAAYSNGKAADSIQTILNIARTAEQLGVTFYTQALAHANRLGFSDPARLDIKAALVEEQIHERFLAAQGAKALTSKFSFPDGNGPFESLDAFIKVQQLLEMAFIAAYIAAGREFAMLNRPDLVQIAAQIGSVEAEHRAIGRAIGGRRPANNHAFSPALLKKVGDAPGVLKQAGFLSPTEGNVFVFKPVSTNFDGIVNRTVGEQTFS